MIDFFLTPFTSFLFMKQALLACVFLSLSCAPMGVLLILRRMSLVGDALSHAILPGIAIGFLIWGLWLPGLIIGGIVAGMVVTLGSGLIARRTILAEDASFSGFYLISLALGVLILSVKGGSVNLMHFLFGSVLAVDQASLLFITGVSMLTILVVILTYRSFVYECFDPMFVRLRGVNGGGYHLLFLCLVVLNLVAACQTLGTLMALGMMMLPSITARLIARQSWKIMGLSACIGVFSSYIGLVLSFHYNWPAGPTIILVTGCFYVMGLVVHTYRA